MVQKRICYAKRAPTLGVPLIKHMSTLVFAATKSGLPPLRMSDRFRQEITYFMSLPDEPGVPKLPPGEYWIRLDRSRQWLDDGVFTLISPLDSEHPAEIELSEEQETWLEWMLANQVEHVRLG